MTDETIQTPEITVQDDIDTSGQLATAVFIGLMLILLLIIFALATAA